MKLNAQLEIINNTAVQKGVKSKRQSYFSSLSIAKDQKFGNYYLIINNTKKSVADKFRLLNNIEKIFCRFVNEGKATVVMKEPNFSLNLQKAEVPQLKAFLKILNSAANSPKFSEETFAQAQKEAVDLDKENKQLKKPITSISITSKKAYESNFRAVISQNLFYIKSKIDIKGSNIMNLVRLTMTGCELKQLNRSIFELRQLAYLDLSDNKLTAFDDFAFEALSELNLSNNQIKYIGKKIALPQLIKLTIDNNLLTHLDHHFCLNFTKLMTLSFKNNKIVHLPPNFGYNLLNLKYLDASINQFDTIPHSFSYLRLEIIDLAGNPFDYTKLLSKPAEKNKFPTLVEIATRYVINRKIKFKPGDIPRTLIDYTETRARCLCGQSCFEYRFNLVTMIEMSQIARSYSCFTVNGFLNHIPASVTLCSLRCRSKNLKMQRSLTPQSI